LVTEARTWDQPGIDLRPRVPPGEAERSKRRRPAATTTMPERPRTSAWRAGWTIAGGWPPG